MPFGKEKIDRVQHKALLVDSDAKALKEQSMHEQARSRYEHGLEAVKAGLSKKNGTKTICWALHRNCWEPESL